MPADAIIGFTALIAQFFMQVLLVSIKPWRYCLSKDFRNEINKQLSHKPRYLTYLNILGGIIIIILSIGIVAALIKFFFFTQEPETTATEKIEENIKTIIVNTIKKKK